MASIVSGIALDPLSDRSRNVKELKSTSSKECYHSRLAHLSVGGRANAIGFK